MSWVKFLTILAVVYVLYYLFNVVIDMLRTQGSSVKSDASNELTFHEDVMTTEVNDHIPIEVKESEPVQNEQEETTVNTVWERQEEDTEELNLLSHNVNQSTGGVTQMSDLIKLAKSDTIDVKRSLVF